MRDLSAGGLFRLGTSSRRGGRLLLTEPALQGAFTGEGPLGIGQTQVDADVAGAPARMLLA